MKDNPSQESHALFNATRATIGLFFLGCAALGSRYLNRKERIKKTKSSLDKLHRANDLHEIDEEKYNQLLAIYESDVHNLSLLYEQFNELTGANQLATTPTVTTRSHSPTFFATAGASSSMPESISHRSLPTSSGIGKQSSVEAKLNRKLSIGIKQLEENNLDLQRRYEELCERMYLVSLESAKLTDEIEKYVTNTKNSSLTGGK